MSRSYERYRLTLTDRERDVVGAILRGHTTDKEIGQALAISPKTAMTHVNVVLEKTGARNKIEVVLMAVGLIECPIPMPTIKKEQ